MGQQQLLLLVLSIVIVGLAVIGGIEAFSQNRVKTTRDMALQDALRLASQVQAWRLKPKAMGGGGGEWPTSLWGQVLPEDENGSHHKPGYYVDVPGGSVKLLNASHQNNSGETPILRVTLHGAKKYWNLKVRIPEQGEPYMENSNNVF